MVEEEVVVAVSHRLPVQAVECMHSSSIATYLHLEERQIEEGLDGLDAEAVQHRGLSGNDVRATLTCKLLDLVVGDDALVVEVLVVGLGFAGA